MNEPLRLRGISGEVKGKVWESESLLRAGRLETLEIVLNAESVSRRHAELHNRNNGWWVRDVGSTNGTYVNGERLGKSERQLHARDVLQFGKVAMMVEIGGSAPAPAGQAAEQIIVGAAISASWEEGLQRLAFDRNRQPRNGDQLLALFRAGHHLFNTTGEDDLFQSILADAIALLDAERGAIVLADLPEDDLRLRALRESNSPGSGASPSTDEAFSDHPHVLLFSKDIAEQCFSRAESILYGCRCAEREHRRENWAVHDRPTTPSMLCVLLRTPGQCLGVLHLERSGYKRREFTENDLHLADAFAAHISLGIEGAGFPRPRHALADTAMIQTDDRRQHGDD